ncbi:MAG: putative ABC transporter permease [Clostridiales bacterium]|nr:putative ABC transporter permease [Clostridiales bacterium]
MNRLKSDCILFSIGGVGYALLEILWRRKTHWTMALTGGTCFVSLYRFYQRHSKMKLVSRCLSGSAIITFIEFFCGCIVNLKYKLNVWDYSDCRYNLKGQVCPFYSTLWALLCIPLSALCNRINKREKSLAEFHPRP